MDKNSIIFLNGKFVKYYQSNIGLLNHSLSYGMAINDNIRVYGKKGNYYTIGLEKYINRFLKSTEKMGIEINYDKKGIKKLIKYTLKLNSNIKHPYIRLIGFFGDKSINPIPSTENSCFGIAIIDLKYFNKTYKLGISNYKRSNSNLNKLKNAGNYSKNISENIVHIKKGYDNIIILDKKNNILETLNQNIFIIKNGEVFTPKIENIVPGIIRCLTIEMLKKLNIKIIEKNIKEKDLLTADEIFLTSTALGITNVSQINKTKYNNKNITKQVDDYFYQLSTIKKIGTFIIEKI